MQYVSLCQLKKSECIVFILSPVVGSPNGADHLNVTSVGALHVIDGAVAPTVKINS